MTPGISVENLSVKLGGTDVLTNCSLVVPSGTVTALLGPSGCGKTTLLRAVAGLVHPSAGEIQIGTDVVSRPGTAVPPEKRRVGMVFQDGALFDHMTVAATSPSVSPDGNVQAQRSPRRSSWSVLGVWPTACPPPCQGDRRSALR
ncbi:MAG: ATP-binding cassette domain-containing protein [Acidimicrobiia bacterium]|nr:ATP-binding cassette domain-containing protein [Acidimicrobiia bacterium]